MSKCSIFVWKNVKFQRTILNAPGFAFPEKSINQGQEVLTKFCSMFVEIFKESEHIHAWSVVATPKNRKECNQQPHHDVVTHMEESNSENKCTMIPLIIYPGDSSDNEEDPPSGIL